ncbi:hypothetical protein VNO80_08410 [Phaseolus coccineus]|uniref:Uncharacterized protein n=1 Tax=Phaseolus coccineus TaxID=3886 RepID=A0AAN9NLH9_PHACN
MKAGIHLFLVCVIVGCSPWPLAELNCMFRTPGLPFSADLRCEWQIGNKSKQLLNNLKFIPLCGYML